MGYTCKECGKPVIVKSDGSIERTCEHKGTVIAGMTAVAKGVGAVAGSGK